VTSAAKEPGERGAVRAMGLFGVGGSAWVGSDERAAARVFSETGQIGSGRLTLNMIVLSRGGAKQAYFFRAMSHSMSEWMFRPRLVKL
jgi:hypothetical protein